MPNFTDRPFFGLTDCLFKASKRLLSCFTVINSESNPHKANFAQVESIIRTILDSKAEALKHAVLFE